jgi:hypothetical protein
MSNEAQMLPAVIPFTGEWKLLENEKPVGFIDVLCILSNHGIVTLRFSDMLEENNGFFHTYSDYSFERNPVIYWTYMLECPL